MRVGRVHVHRWKVMRYFNASHIAVNYSTICTKYVITVTNSQLNPWKFNEVV